MKKKILSLLMSLVMIAGLAVVPAGTADAASNKGGVVLGKFWDDVSWNTADWNNRVDMYVWGSDTPITLSSNATLSYTLYMPKYIFDKKGSGDGTHAFSLLFQLELYNGDEWLGQLRSTADMWVIKEDGEYNVRVDGIDGADGGDANAWSSVKEVGDYAVLTVKDYPLGGNVFRWDDNAGQEVSNPLDFSKQYTFDTVLQLCPNNGIGGDVMFVIDDIQIKDSGNVIFSQDFENADQNCMSSWFPEHEDDHTLHKGTAYTTSILSLKEKNTTVKVGKKAKIKATAIKGATVTYKSNKPKVATVDKNGKVKGLKKGKAVISVSCMGKTLKYTVKVTK